MQTKTKAALLKNTIEAVRPEARLLIESARQDLSTKHGYGVIYNALSITSQKSVGAAKVLLLALALEGYDKETCRNLMLMMGW